MDEDRMAAKASPEWFLLLARAWLTVARTAVPWGMVTKVVDCVGLPEATLLETGLADGVLLDGVLFEAVLVEADWGFGAGALAATTLPDSGFLATGFVAVVFGAAGLLTDFAVTAFLGGGGA